MTIGDYLERWLEHIRQRVRTRTSERYAGIVRGHLIPRLGHIPLRKLTPLVIQQFEAKALEGGRLRGEGGLSPQTVLHLHRVLSEALRQAVRWQLLPANPAAAVSPPRPRRAEIAIVGPESAQAILDAARGTAVEIPVTVAIGTGMRRGEILGLRWADMDLEAHVAHVRQTLQDTTNGLVFEAPKTDRSRRTVSLPEFVVSALRRHRSDQAARRLALGRAWLDHDLVLDRGDGGPMRPDSLSSGFRQLTKRSGLDGTRFHDLRHAHATLMLAAGVHPKVVSERLGHSGVAITLDTYSHVIPALQAEAAGVLDNLLTDRKQSS